MVTTSLQCIQKEPNSLKLVERNCSLMLNKLACIVRSDLSALSRAILGALITIDVHARDIVTELIINKVSFFLETYHFQINFAK